MAADIFAKLGDIKGESLDDKHKDEIEVFSFSWGMTHSAPVGSSGSGGGPHKATFKEFSIVHSIDKASPSLLAACATGTHLKEATITQRKAGKGQQEFLIFKMNDVIVTGVTEVSGAPDSETVTLAFAKIDVEYKAQKADGSLDASVHFKFDLNTNKMG